MFPLMSAASAQRYEFEPNNELFGSLNIDGASEPIMSEAVHLVLEHLRLSESFGTDATTFLPMLSAGDFPQVLDRAIAAVDPNNLNESRESFLYGHDAALDDDSNDEITLGKREIRALEVGAGRV